MAVARRHGQPPAASSTSTNLARQLHDRRRYPCSLREYSVVRRPPASSNASLHNVARGNRRCQGYATAAALVRCKWPMWHRERAAGYWRLGIVRGPERRRCPNRATFGSRTAPAALDDGLWWDGDHSLTGPVATGPYQGWAGRRDGREFGEIQSISGEFQDFARTDRLT